MVLRAAAQRAIDVKIYLPDSSDSELMAVESRILSVASSEHSATIENIGKKIGESWNSATKRPGSNISVFRMTDPSTFGLASFDNAVALIIPPFISPASQDTFVVRFATDSQPPVATWARGLLDQAERAGYDLYFEDRPIAGLPRSTTAAS